MSEQKLVTRTFLPILFYLAAIWVIQFINFFMSYDLNAWFGLRPRVSSGLPGILFTPLLHGNFGHAAANSAPLALMGGMILLIDRRLFLPALALIVLIGGFGTWLIGGKNTVHIGASGVVFGFFGFLVAFGLRRRNIPSILGAAAAIAFYWYMLRGILPSGPGISWEGHLAGLLGGVIAGALLGRRKQETKLSE